MGQMYVSRMGQGGPMPVRMLFIFQAAPWIIWWLAIPGILAISGYGARRNFGWQRVAALHVFPSLALAFLPSAVVVFGLKVFDPQVVTRPFSTEYVTLLGLRYGFDVTTYIAIAALTTIADLFRRTQEEYARAARLEAELSQARLHALAAQVEPHFLFNALNAVAMLIRQK